MEGAESGVEGAESGEEGAGRGDRGGGIEGGKSGKIWVGNGFFTENFENIARNNDRFRSINHIKVH